MITDALKAGLATSITATAIQRAYEQFDYYPPGDTLVSLKDEKTSRYIFWFVSGATAKLLTSIL